MTGALTGIVVVSHSRALAGAAVTLAEEMLHGAPARIEIAAGLDDETFGTDAVQIAEAIGRADSGAGAVVLMDLGSAVLSAELALDLMDGDARDRVVLCPAPLVEGLIVAAVAATSGAPPAEVAAEAVAALAGKQSHLADGAPPPAPARAVETEGITGSFTLVNPHGLHARPAAQLVRTVRGLNAQVLVRNRTLGTEPVPAASLSRVATLGALAGHEVEVTARGPQAREALDQVLAQAAAGFGEGGPRSGPGSVPECDTAAPPPRPSPLERPAPAAPMPASPGVAVGPAILFGAAAAEPVPDTPAGDPASERRRLRDAVAAVHRDVERVRERTAREVGAAEAAIFDAHLLLLDDPELADDVAARIEAGQAAAPAWAAVVAEVASRLADLPDPYLQARAADVRAVGDQVLAGLAGDRAGGLAADGVLVAADLTPAQAAELDPARTVAVVLAAGSPTSHAAILVRARGIPAVVGAGSAVLDVAAGTLIAVDGGRGEAVVDPPADVRDAFVRRAAGLAARRARAAERAAEPAVTRDGVRVLVGANIGSAADAAAATAAGADLAGLVRTEFCFLGRTRAPDVDEQEAAYRRIAEALDGRRVTLRTLDVGGDKPLAYLPMPAEANPFLGVRGLRLSLARPQLLADQLLAIVRVAHDHPVDLMFPMVSTLDELVAARRLLHDAVLRAGQGEPAGLRLGIMVEVPAAALKARTFAPHVDFLSVGTNDLTQYALAAERGNEVLAPLADPFDPGLLQLVAAAGAVATDDLLVAVCGEFAADELATALLVGLGVRELSVSPAAVPVVKEAVRGIEAGEAARLAQRALAAPDAAAVRRLCG